MPTSLLGDLGHVSQIHKVLLQASLQKDDVVVDATLGNGFDALTLLELVGSNGYLYGFDIQQEAIDATKLKLSNAGYENMSLILENHSRMSEHLKDCQIRGVVFNLGYLPKGEKAVTTLWETTQTAISQAMELIMEEGFISVMTYPGHETGQIEDEHLNNWLEALPQKKFQVSKMEFINQQNNPPRLYWITKRQMNKTKERL